jgi:hypothetical protein
MTAAAGPRHNLPLALTRFIGRERELVDVRGRTRLALVPHVGVSKQRGQPLIAGCDRCAHSLGMEG